MRAGEEVLVKKLSAGDKDAYSSLYQMYYVPLVHYSCRIVKKQEVAEDIVQGFFCWLWEEHRRLTEITYFKTYFYTAVRNLSLDFLKIKTLNNIPEKESATTGNFLEDIMEEEIFRLLHTAIQQLPQKCRQIMLMHLEGEDNQQIAKELNINEDTVRSQLRRGREILHDKFSGTREQLFLFYLFRI